MTDDGRVRSRADVLGFGQAVGAVLGSILTEDLVGTYVVGSVALAAM